MCFLFDEGKPTTICLSPSPQEIPKTIVFFDSKKDAYSAIQECRKWLQLKHGYSKRAARKIIKVFHCDTAEADKESTIAAFEKLGRNASVRVIFATEALRLDVNLLDVWCTILYSLLAHRIGC